MARNAISVWFHSKKWKSFDLITMGSVLCAAKLLSVWPRTLQQPCRGAQHGRLEFDGGGAQYSGLIETIIVLVTRCALSPQPQHGECEGEHSVHQQLLRRTDARPHQLRRYPRINSCCSSHPPAYREAVGRRFGYAEGPAR